MVLAFLAVACGLILDTVTRGRRELKLLAYLAQRAPAEERRRSSSDRCTSSSAPTTRC